jgi:hypothetical protein
MGVFLACSWVLWTLLVDASADGREAKSGPWEIFQAFSSQAPCDAAVQSKTKGAPLNMVKFKEEADGTTFIRYLCVPDSVDPRAPKGARSN